MNRSGIDTETIVKHYYRWNFTANRYVQATTVDGNPLTELTLSSRINDQLYVDAMTTAELQKLVDVIRLADPGVK